MQLIGAGRAGEPGRSASEDAIIKKLCSAGGWGIGAALLSYGTKYMIRDVTERDIWTSLLVGVVVAILTSIPWKKKAAQEGKG
ncbi:MAG TPA: hypothetical protein VD866_06675 [Urbifossiella sp.]|nr:hypothetical protein [Urbifossiella sp.]